MANEFSDIHWNESWRKKNIDETTIHFYGDQFVWFLIRKNINTMWFFSCAAVIKFWIQTQLKVCEGGIQPTMIGSHCLYADNWTFKYTYTVGTFDGTYYHLNIYCEFKIWNEKYFSDCGLPLNEDDFHVDCVLLWWNEKYANCIRFARLKLIRSIVGKRSVHETWKKHCLFLQEDVLSLGIGFKKCRIDACVDESKHCMHSSFKLRAKR